MILKLGLENIFRCAVLVYVLLLPDLCCTYLEQYAAFRVMSDRKLLQAIRRILVYCFTSYVISIYSVKSSLCN